MDLKGALLYQLKSLPIMCWILIVIAGALAAVITVSSNKKNTIRKRQIVFTAILTSYIVFILCMTVIREPGSGFKAELIPFGSYSIPSLRNEIILNYILFIPFGFLLCLSRDMKIKKVVLTGFLFSLSIELSQLIFRVGLFEFDDMIGNTVGCLLGASVGKVVRNGFCK